MGASTQPEAVVKRQLLGYTKQTYGINVHFQQRIMWLLEQMSVGVYVSKNGQLLM